MCRAVFATIVLMGLRPAGTAGADRANQVTRPNVEVKYDLLTREYANAIADVCQAARDICIERFGADLPPRLRVRVEVNWRTGPCLFTNGHDEIVLRLSSGQQLQPNTMATAQHLDYVYGFCRVIGQLAMDRALPAQEAITTEGREGWGHYAGCLLVGALQCQRGRGIWPDASRHDHRVGIPALVRQLEYRDVPAIVQAAGHWKRLAEFGGPRTIPVVFRFAGQQYDAGTVPDETIPPALASLARSPRWPPVRSLWTAHEEKPADALADAGALCDVPLVLHHDDGKAEERRHLAGQGHAVRFDAPAGVWYLRGVWILARRDGMTSMNHDDVSVWLCDGRMNRLAEFRQRDRQLRRGPARWHRIGTPPVRVPRRFTIVVRFASHTPRGVSVYCDTSRAGNSFVEVSDGLVQPFKGGNWMLRVALDRLREHDPLRPPFTEDSRQPSPAQERRQ